MPSRKQLEKALRGAHNAGDTEAATQLANALKDYDEPLEPLVVDEVIEPAEMEAPEKEEIVEPVQEIAPEPVAEKPKKKEVNPLLVVEKLMKQQNKIAERTEKNNQQNIKFMQDLLKKPDMTNNYPSVVTPIKKESKNIKKTAKVDNIIRDDKYLLKSFEFTIIETEV